jgi:hypothetical protein
LFSGVTAVAGREYFTPSVLDKPVDIPSYIIPKGTTEAQEEITHVIEFMDLPHHKRMPTIDDHEGYRYILKRHDHPRILYLPGK